MNIFKVLFLMLFIGLEMKAQEVLVQEDVQKKKEINEIKLGEQAVYAEVIELATDDFEAVNLAQQRSINKLQNNVIEACAKKMNMSKEDVKEIFDIVDDKCQNVVIKKGDMLRVFSYIAKDAVGLGRKKTSKEELEEIFGTDSIDMNVAQIIADTTQVVTQAAVVQNVDKAVEQAIQVAGQAVQANGQVSTPVSQTVVVVQQPAQSSASVVLPAQTVVVVQQPAAATTQTSVVAAPVAEVKEAVPAVEEKPAVEVAIPSLCQAMISKGNMNDLMRYLNQEKRYQHLMFGNFNAMQYPEKCYIVLIDKSTRNIVSVLDKGETERMNFITKKLDRYSNYRGGNYAAIFVQEY